MAEPSEKISVSQRQWSTLVDEADQTAEDKTAYRFSNSRKFDAGAGATEPTA